MRGGRAPLRGVPGARRRVARRRRRRDVRVHRRERLGQEHAAQVHRADPAARHADDRGRRQGVGAARARRRVPSGALRPRERLPQRRDPRAVQDASSTPLRRIVEFAGLERFIDTPVKNYSSGMYVRLGFSVAINVDPDVLLVDEVLAVGDEQFQRKCNEKFAELRSRRQDRSSSCRTRLGVRAHDVRPCRVARAGAGQGHRAAASDDRRRVRRRRPPSQRQTRPMAACEWGSGEAASNASSCSTPRARRRRSVAHGRRRRIRAALLRDEPIARPVFGVGIHTIDGFQ